MLGVSISSAHYKEEEKPIDDHSAFSSE